MIKVTFACGHTLNIGENPQAAPVCVCGESRITRTKSRPPIFRGVATGPYTETKAMDPGVVNVASAGPLRLKES